MLTLVQYEEAIWYAPDIADNREKPEDEQFAVQLVPLTTAEMRRLEEAAGKLTRKKVNFVRRHNELRAVILKRCIKDIRNLTFARVVDGQTRREEVRAPSMLVDQVAPEELLTELLGVLIDQSRLAEGLVGKSSSPSSSATPAMPRGDGAARGAGGESGPTSLSANAAPPAVATDPSPASGSPGRPSSSAAPGLS